MNKERNIIILLGAVIVAILGYKISDLAFESVDKDKTSDKRIVLDTPKDVTYISPRKEKFNGKPQDEIDFPEKIENKILKGEKILHFGSKEEMDAFLARAKQNGFKIIQKIDDLNLVKVRFTKSTKSNDFLSRFDEVTLISDNDPVSIPDPLLQGSASGFRSHPLDFLGITNNTGWGEGVTVAVIDTGIADHPALKGNITHIDLINDGSEITSFHGTAVASLIAGDSSLVKGISPSADILDIRALGSDGTGDAFTVALAIREAVNNNAQVINLSLGSPSDNAALKQAILYAQSKGVIIVAAVGNEGADQVSFPASYQGVIGVGANDANEGYLTFSNKGPQVDLTAPGIELTAAGVSNDVVLFTGTSASAPLVAGTVAHMLEQNPDLGYSDIIDALQDNANEAGAPGEDVFFGEGILNVGRFESNNAAPTIDPAAAGFYLEESFDGKSLNLFAIGENRGTEEIVQVEMTVSYPGFQQTFVFNNVESSQTFFETIKLDLNSPVITEEQEIVIQVKTLKDEAILDNNVKGVKIRLNAQ